MHIIFYLGVLQITLQYVHSDDYFVDEACKDLYRCMIRKKLDELSTKYDMVYVIYPTVYKLLGSEKPGYSMAKAASKLANALCDGLSKRDMQLVESSTSCKREVQVCLDMFVSAIKNPSCFKLCPPWPQINENGDVTDKQGNICYKQTYFKSGNGLEYFGITPNENQCDGKRIEHDIQRHQIKDRRRRRKRMTQLYKDNGENSFQQTDKN